MAKRMSRAERHAARRKAVEAEKREPHQAMKGGGHFYFAEWHRRHRKNGDAVIVEAMEELWGELARHDLDNPPTPNYGMDDAHMNRMRDLESRRREARDLERAAGIAEGARKKAAGIGGDLAAAKRVMEPEPEEEEPDAEQEEHEDRRHTLASHGLVSRMPGPPAEGRRKRRRGYSYPPFVG